MALSIKEAIDLTGVPKSTLWRYIKTGRISAAKNEKGEYEIDMAELYRVFHKTLGTPGTEDGTGVGTELERVASRHELQTQLEGLRQLVAAHERTIDSKSEDIKDLRKRLDLSEEKLGVSESERRVLTEKVTALLTHDIEQKKVTPRWGLVTGLSALFLLTIAALIALKLDLFSLIHQ
jgi:predicted site-specific integrase-resolvase